MTPTTGISNQKATNKTICWNIGLAGQGRAGQGHGWPVEGSVLDPGFAYKWGRRRNSK